MGLTDLQLIFDNPQHTYYAGQTVSGRLIVTINSPKDLRSITAKFKGEAECNWSESTTVHRDGKTEEEMRHFRGHESYFENRIRLFGGSGNTETLPSGEHCYQFSMILPNNLPSSFEGNYGFIRYTVKATLDRPWKFDHEVKSAFTVLSHVDLNLDLRNREPFKQENYKTFCCCCCKSGPLTLVSHIPARGYVSGQIIHLTVEVDNASNVNIHKVVCELQKVVKYHSHSPRISTKEDCVVVTSLEFDGSVTENDSKTWTEKLQIPPLPPSQLRECSIIDLEYTLKIKAKPDGCHGELLNIIPITIGTVPIWQGFPTQDMPFAVPQPMPITMPTPSAPPQIGDNFMPTAPYPYIPPPTYEECTFGTTSISDSDDNKHVFGISGYNPRYPTYNLPGNPSVGWNPPTYGDTVSKSEAMS